MNNVITTKQYGGMQGHSTILQLIRVVELLNIELHRTDFDEKGVEYALNIKNCSVFC